MSKMLIYEIGLSLLCGFPLVAPGSVQRSHALKYSEPHTSLRNSQAGFLRNRRRSCIQRDVL